VLGLRLFRQKQLLLFPWILAMKMQTKILLGLVGLTMVSALAQGRWRAATEKELSSLLRARVEKEQIETEMCTASGVTNGKGKFFAAVVIITAGYAAEGKYGYFLTAQVPVRAGDVSLPAGAYVFGQRRLPSAFFLFPSSFLTKRNNFPSLERKKKEEGSLESALRNKTDWSAMQSRRCSWISKHVCGLAGPKV
jgi:hypothetical protein